MSEYLQVIPSALRSCILVQAETILMDNLSTTNTRHSTPVALPATAFFGGPLYLTTSFIISGIFSHTFYFISYFFYWMSRKRGINNFQENRSCFFPLSSFSYFFDGMREKVFHFAISQKCFSCIFSRLSRIDGLIDRFNI